ncbi:winged helix-turn-helix domain-containing protein [Steroidobacter agaridevorans]|uniref:winged helix-turn-helix domain-containing protein n=1 Tax=Steroidobacter agaridevorans TaxID=2695856 RepID=UPI00192A36F2|nr:crosslink repair DNA glycosylase YcaQ family protein [Steroidobacter agaridevorans]
MRRLGVVQMDSVNVLCRSHYLPVFSRRGDYKSALLERAAYDERLLFEYWGHEASLLPIESYPLFRWRMDDARKGVGTWGRLKRYATSHQDLVKGAIDQIRERGPLGASELTDAGKSKGSWWGWSQGKEILEWLFWIGDVTTARRRNFERLYDLPERVLPESVRNAPVPARESAQRELMMIGARAMGVATARDLRDYFRLPTKEAAMRLAELVEEGRLVPVSVEGWKQQGYLHHEAKIPRASKIADVAALLSPFDSLIWERQRTERLFDFHFRLEIYTPLHKRVHGYYVLPLLLGERVVGRVDLKSERQSGVLQVKGGSVEPGVVPARVAEPLAKQLVELASWLGLENYAVTSRKGELMRALKKLKAR